MKLGRYKLLERIAVGGMAELFLGKLEGVEGFEKRVAIKKILPQWSSDPDFIAMLVDEAKIVVSLNHPNIVQVIELAQEREFYYLVMEYVPGMDLRALIRQSAPLPTEIACLITEEILSGLSYAHSKGIVHRDISPQNLLLSDDGHVKITDFGIAKAASRSQESQTGVLKGKFAYMSPEQASGKEIDQRTDLFSLGSVFYEMLTGEPLFKTKGDLDTLDQVRRGQILFSPQFNSRADPLLKKILERSLAADPVERFEGSTAFREELTHYTVEKKMSLRPETLAAYLKKEAKPVKKDPFEAVTVSLRLPRRFRIIPGVTLLLGGLVGGILYLKYSNSFSPPAPQIEERATGSLSVQVIPWGTVVIDGKKSYEAPVSQLSLPEGDHHLKVFYEPRKEHYETEVHLSAGLHAVCLADFKNGRGIECR